MTTETKDQYAWSRNEEDYHGRFDSREEAIAEAHPLADDDHFDAKGDKLTVYTGRCVSPDEVLALSKPEWTGEHVLERINELLADEIPAEDEDIVKLTADQKAELGILIHTYVMEHAEKGRYGIDQVQTHEVTVTETL